MYEEKEELVTIIKQAAKERLQMEKQLAKIRPNPVSCRLWGKFMVYISRLAKFLINGSVKKRTRGNRIIELIDFVTCLSLTSGEFKH